MARLRALLPTALALFALGRGALAQDAGAPAGDTRLAGHLALLAQRGLAPPAAQSVEELDALLGEAHARVRSGRNDQAALLLLEAVEGPRFRAFEALDSFAAAELALASVMIDQRALGTAQRSVERLLARGVASRTFGPAYRRAVDIALARRDYAHSAERLTALVTAPLPKDATHELHYVRALAAYDAGNEAEAARELGAIGKSSRFYPGAQYLLGAIAAQAGQYDAAHARFCAVRKVAPASAPRALYGAPGLVPTDDDARLGMGRVAHERGRHEEAFDHYFAVPADSPLLAEALFESAYASYERGEHTTALDSLAQLEARYPRSPLTAEARVLRGYAHLGRCDFDRAERELVTFERTFGEVLRELDATLASEAETRSLYEAARDRDERASHASLLEALVVRDPEVEHRRSQLAALDAELARSGNTSSTFASLAARVRGGEAKHARSESTTLAARSALLRGRMAETRVALRSFRSELRALRRAGAKRAELGELEAVARMLQQRIERAERELREQDSARGDEEREAPLAGELARRLEQEQQDALRSEQRAARVRKELERALAAAERQALSVLRERLAKELRRAHIGRIDAVMGKKRKAELEVESLAAGRFPPELPSRTRRSALLRDDEEYWPFEGEDWPDEFREPAVREEKRR